MKTTEIIKKEIEVKKDTHTCDICKKRTMEEDRSWGTRATLSYSENNGLLAKGDKRIIDVCMYCMRNEVMPLICKHFNVKPRRED